MAYGVIRRVRNLGLVATLVLPGAAIAEPITLVAFGDSLTAGFGLPPDQGLVPQLQAWLQAQGADVTVINAGVSGDTTAGGASRIDWTLTPDVDAMILTLGGNDMLRGSDPAQAERNLDAIVAKLKDAKVAVWIAGMLAPRNFGPEYAAQFDGLYRRVADKYGVPLYPFLLDGVAQDPALNQPDGIHPNPKGVGILVEKMLPFLVKSLDDHAAPVHRPARP